MDLEALGNAVFTLDAPKVKRMLDSPAYAKLTKRELGTLLFNTNPNASGVKQLALFRSMLEHGADVKVKNDEGDWLIADIACRMTPAVLALVLEHGADPNVDRGRALALVCDQPDKHTPAKIALLVGAGANVNARPWREDNDTVLTFGLALCTIDASTVEALIAHGIDVNAKTKRGATALDIAEEKELTELAELIRAAGGKHARAEVDRTRPTKIEQVLGARVSRAKSPHACGLPVTSIYKTSKALGGRFPSCAFPPRHLISLALDKLPFPPAVQKVGVLHVVHHGCEDCEPPDFASYAIDKSGKVSPLDAKDRRRKCTTPVPPDYAKPVAVEVTTKVVPPKQRLPVDVGGAPSWHQQPTWPSCERCGLKMFFVVQIGGDERLYIFLCEKCRVMTTVRQLN